MTRRFDLEDSTKEILYSRKYCLLPGEDQSKWVPNNEGPLLVKKAFSGGAILLFRMDGEDLVKPMDADSIKKYYTSQSIK
jgi:hypothetical protein